MDLVHGPTEEMDGTDVLFEDEVPEADVTSAALINRVTRDLLEVGGALNPPYPAFEGIPAGRVGWESYLASSPPAKIHVLLAKMELEKGKVQSGAGAV